MDSNCYDDSQRNILQRELDEKNIFTFHDDSVTVKSYFDLGGVPLFREVKANTTVDPDRTTALNAQRDIMKLKVVCLNTDLL